MDYAATTPVAECVLQAMLPWLRDRPGNAASLTHGWGRQAQAMVEASRQDLAQLVGAEAREIIWTSGATEANNLAIKGVADAYANRGRQLISLRTEHKSVLDPLCQLEQAGFRVSWLVPDADGRLRMADLTAALSEQCTLVSVMLVNNETGVVQDIPAIAAAVHDSGALLHVDAAQALGKLPIDVQALDVDLMSFCAHKLYGPKGIGALYVRRRPHVRLTAQQHGGGHERGLRSGTLPTHQIAGFAAACTLAAQEMPAEALRITALRQRLWQGISSLPGILLNGHPDKRVAGILNVSVEGVDGEALFAALEMEGLGVSAGSACTAASAESSYVLRALGRSDELAYASVRFSLGRDSSQAEVDAAIGIFTAGVTRLRQLSPVWEAGATP